MTARDRAFIQVKEVGSQPQEVIDRLASYYRCLPGKVAVVDDLKVEQIGSLVLPNYGNMDGAFDSDSGVVLSSGVHDIPAGSRVIFKTSHGLQHDHHDNPLIPEGSRVRLFGVSASVYESILGIIENENKTENQRITNG